MSEHTKGPWHFERIGANWRNAHEKGMAVRITAPEVSGAAEWDIGVLYYKGLWETAEANARLIAAAPEMLEALEDLSGWTYGHNNYDCADGAPCTCGYNDALEKAKAALRKAKGEA